MSNTRSFELAYLRTLRHVFDTEKQLSVSLRSLYASSIDKDLASALQEIETQSERQLERLSGIFRSLYLEPRGEASWVTAALLREAWEAASGEGGTTGCAAALLALKRYELTLYEALLRWSETCDLYEALPAIRRSIAEELLQASILAGFAFSTGRDEPAVAPRQERRALH